MDFSDLLGREIEQRRKKAKLGKPKAAPTPAAQESPGKTAPASPTAPTEPAAELTEQDKLLQTVDDKKLAASLAALEGGSSDAHSKEEQLRKLQLHVEKEKKDQRYQAYLRRENGVEVRVALDDVLAEKTDMLALQVRRFLKEILAAWAANDPDDPLLQETKRDVVKLLYKLRSNKLNHDMLISLSTIVYHIQNEHITQANEAYLKLSIGNVAWPIGVRDVGIHARAADAKIAGDDKSQLANIMKSETTRRWLIAVKRVINYCTQLHKGTSGA